MGITNVLGHSFANAKYASRNSRECEGSRLTGVCNIIPKDMLILMHSRWRKIRDRKEEQPKHAKTDRKLIIIKKRCKQLDYEASAHLWKDDDKVRERIIECKCELVEGRRNTNSTRAHAVRAKKAVLRTVVPSPNKRWRKQCDPHQGSSSTQSPTQMKQAVGDHSRANLYQVPAKGQTTSSSSQNWQWSSWDWQQS